MEQRRNHSFDSELVKQVQVEWCVATSCFSVGLAAPSPGTQRMDKGYGRKDGVTGIFWSIFPPIHRQACFFLVLSSHVEQHSIIFQGLTMNRRLCTLKALPLLRGLYSQECFRRNVFDLKVCGSLFKRGIVLSEIHSYLCWKTQV